MAQISNVSEVNLENVVVKTVRKVKNIRIKKYKKKRSGVKSKGNLYFKRKRLIRSLALRKRLLTMSNGQDASSLVHMSGKRWQQEDEVAFWKARAVSLEYENKMLHKHIKQMYIGMISQNTDAALDYKEYEEQYNEEDYGETEESRLEDTLEESGEIYHDCEQEIQEDIEDEEFNKESKEFRKKRDEERAKAKKKVDSEDEEESKPPEAQLSKIREVKMKQMYGEAWRKIMGMETAIQLNYELTVERDNVKYWPCLPINL